MHLNNEACIIRNIKTINNQNQGKNTTMLKKITTDKIELVYITNNGEEITQPLNNLIETGTLIDPDTEEDLNINHVLIYDKNTHQADTEKTQLIYIDETGNEHAQYVSEIPHNGTLIDPTTEEDMEITYILHDMK